MDTPKSSFAGISNEMPTYLQSSFGRTSETPKSRPQGKRIIESKIGISQESPTYFHTLHGAISSDTYKNPYISGQPDKNTISPLKNKQTFSIFNKLRDDQKKDFFHIKEVQTQPIYNLLTHQKTDVGKIELQINERAKFNDDYKTLQDTQQTPFHRKSNQFSDFVERNDVMNVYGHLNMRDRPTQFKRVKDYSLDQNQLDMIRTIRENSQPSHLSRNNSSISVLTPRLVQNTNQDSFQNSSIINVGKKSLFKIQSNKNEDIKANSYIGIDFTSSVLPIINQTTHSQTTKDNLYVSKLKVITQQQQNNSNTSRYQTNHSGERYTINQSNTKNKLFTNYSTQTLHHKVPRKIIQTKYDKLKEEESAQELKCIDEFEQHLRFIQGNNFGGSNQGSVFFKDSKRR